jgi:hypothetical protein
VRHKPKPPREESYPVKRSTVRIEITRNRPIVMPPSLRSQKPQDSFMRPSATGISKGSSATATTNRPAPRPLPRHLREENEPEGEFETDQDEITGAEEMDFQATHHVTATQAIGDDTDGEPANNGPELPPPLTPEHAALRADIQMITESSLDRFYQRITADIKATMEKTTSQLQGQILSLNARVSMLQQQVLTCQQAVQHTREIPVTASGPAKKDPKKKTEKAPTSQTAPSAAGNSNPTYATVAATATATPAENTNTEGWMTMKAGGQKVKKAPAPKLIPTTYPQAEREVTCYFDRVEGPDMIQVDNDYKTRQIAADTALHRVNSAIVNNKDVYAPAFIRARVTVRGNIIFTTGNTQTNLIYEDYSEIIKEAVSYHGKCERVEIGKRFSQFLLHGVPTHLSLPEISQSLMTNYPQLAQGQTPRWLTPADRRENKANSTIVLTLTGNIKKANIGCNHLIVCNRQCEVDDYIAYGRSTQCRNCQGYGHPAALCRNNSRCAVCADAHETKEHPCALPICKKGPACTHPPIRCANCNAPHKASDPNCPERIKIREIAKTNTNTITMGDAPEAGVAE